MRILFDDPNRPQDLFQINGELIANGEMVDVEDGYGNYLLKTYPDRLRKADETGPAIDLPNVVAAIVPAVESVESVENVATDVSVEAPPVDAQADAAE